MREGEPSLTALGVALARSTLQRPATATGDAAGDEALTASLLADAPDRYGPRLEAAAPRSGQAVQDLLGFITARTEFFDDAVLRAVGGGITQIVILGAGYDGRALRF